jgi:histidinol dehydrogenase
MIRLIDWQDLSPSDRSEVLKRPAQRLQASALEDARRILDAVRAEGDAALRRLTREIDGIDLDSFEVGGEEMGAAEASLSTQQRHAIEQAEANVRRFHEAQRSSSQEVEMPPGVRCERRELPINAVGLYVPAGTAPLPSTAVMLASPARLAGCPIRILCTPPRRDGRADAAVLFAARLCEVGRVFKLGGAQAIAAMAYGTSSVPKVDKLFGPGNAWVTAAKALVAADPGGAACDLPAGPSEVLVVADESARADFVAADLLAQAEHAADAHVLLVTTSRRLAMDAEREIERQSAALSRRAVLARSLEAACFIVVPDLEAALELSNAYAPEHLVLEVEDPRACLERVRNAGAVFLGALSPEPVGDYCTGANHVLPTSGFARAHGGLALSDFTKWISVQELTPDGLRRLGPLAITLAELEGLDAHARAVAIRLETLGWVEP